MRFKHILVCMVLFLLLSAGSVYAANEPEASAQVNSSSGVILRKSASAKSSQITILADNTNIVILKEVFTSKTSTAKKNVWYYVRCGQYKGYIRSDLVDNISCDAMTAKIKSKVAYRKGPGGKMKKKGTIKKGKDVIVYMCAKPVASAKGGSSKWYKIKVKSKYCYIPSNKVTITGKATGAGSGVNSLVTSNFALMTDAEFDAYLDSQGFPADYKASLKVMHALHPNWAFIGCNTGVNWNDAVNKESADGISLINKSQPSSYRASNTPKEGSTWFNATSQVVAYYMDPRNFLNDEKIYMFEDLSYNGAYQTIEVVSKILTPTRLPLCGFSANLFTDAGMAFNISPVHLASRARQETGGGSLAIEGYTIAGTTVYNPFNIGAGSGSNPVKKGLEYAYKQGWTTQTLAVNGGAYFLASNYICNGQNTVYFQRFNVANGASKVATHQYMTNIQAPYSEATSTKNAYYSYNIVNEPLAFIIPIYAGMPAYTSLP